ncbi:hypothetical protein DDZ18_08875 [Marinicauda salina]|uniref:DUF541 domain-containing protein n=1 Tax=Marinicauda salina TaxID=2135793 RepID=A0A2U2BUT9_9PROT|nr:hypothetical protein [Marinicauda salina]PWE17757.1 hypothetical protein DDZ18_08875 [Marinicauda salina]
MKQWMLAGLAAFAVTAPALAQGEDLRAITIEAEASGSASVPAATGRMILWARVDQELDWLSEVEAATDETGATLVHHQEDIGGGRRFSPPFPEGGAESDASESTVDLRTASVILSGDAASLREAFHMLRESAAEVSSLNTHWRAASSTAGLEAAISDATANALTLSESAAESQGCELGELAGIRLRGSPYSEFREWSDEGIVMQIHGASQGPQEEIVFPEEPLAGRSVTVQATFEAACPID